MKLKNLLFEKREYLNGKLVLRRLVLEKIRTAQ